MRQRLCTTHSNNYDELENVILKSLINICLFNLNKDRIKNSVLNVFNESNRIDKKRGLKKIADDIEKIKDNLDIIYIDRLNKKITAEQFERVKIRLENELMIKQQTYNHLNSDSVSINREHKIKAVNEYIDNFLSMKNLSRELIVNLINKIEIFEDKTINIYVAFDKLKCM